VLPGHASPGQHGSVLPPHAVQVAVALSQTYGSPQTLPPLSAVQQGSPLPPQATHVVPLQVLKGAVHPTPPAQHVLPIAPHVMTPLTQAPAVHVPAVPPHLPVVAATQRPTLWSQHPPALQRLSSQQGSPAAPQVTHAVPTALHAWPEMVQKGATAPLPFGLPGQHASGLTPHVPPVPPVHEEAAAVPVFLQLPRTGLPHEVPGVMHRPLTQQSLAVVQSFSPQHGCVDPPQATFMPLSQTLPVVVASPDAAQTPPTQHPSALHAVAPPQHG
jgi:hypothetical protein